MLNKRNNRGKSNMSWAINTEETFGAKIKVIGVGGGGVL